MTLKVTFEIGHSASRKTKPSKEGFTHDWELFVRGQDGNDIGHFVEKVVFNLHESFPKPKRVIKEPPYTVKEAGYAGFVLKIDIYLKNRDEPKKVTFDYDLDLQPIKTQINEITIPNPADDFKRKCLKGGGVMLPPGDYKNRDSYGKSAPMPPHLDMKKSSKRPEETKPNKTFTNLGAPLKKPDPRALQTASPNPTKLPAASSNKGIEKVSSSSGSGGKEKSEKSKHKHSPNKDGKEVKKEVKDSEKPKKDKTKDRERSDKKEKNSKRPSSPSPSSMPASSSSSSARNSTNTNSLPSSKNELMKPQTTKQSSAPVPAVIDSSFNKKSSKKDKKSHDKERERNEKKESRAKEAAFSTTKEKSHFESVSMKNTSSAGSVKEREPTSNREDRDKVKMKANVAPALPEPKTTPIDSMKKQHEKDAERKHKHKKKEKSKDTGRESSSSKKEKQHKNSATTNASPAKAKEQMPIKYEPPKNISDKESSDSDVDSPPSIKQDSDYSISDTIMQKPPPEIEKLQKKPRERTKVPEKEEKSRKRKKKEERGSSASPPPAAKQARKEISKSPSIQDRPSSSDSAAHQSHMNNNNIDNSGGDRKISSEYMSELKDLKQKITTLKSNDDLQQVVRLIAATGCYEITKSSFDFDLVQLDRLTVQRLQEFFASS
jgi:YEATS domain-containing protein 1/3